MRAFVKVIMACLVNDQSGETVELPDGESTVGRGPLLKITDKRVSRNHALLQLEKGKLRLCPKHKNPCFYKAASQTDFVILPKDVWQELHGGDVIKLLPDALVFRVVEKTCKATTEPTKKRAPHTKTFGAEDSAADLLDELFDDPNAVIKTGSLPQQTLKDNKEKVAMETELDSKSVKHSTKTSGSASGSSASHSQSSLSSSDVKGDDTAKSKVQKTDTTTNKDKADDTTVKSKVKRNDSCGSTNKPRRLPDWLVGVSTSGSSASGGGGGSGGAASRKRKAPSKTSSTTAKKKSDDDGKDNETVSSPPPPKKTKKAAVKDTVTPPTATGSVESRPSTKKEPDTKREPTTKKEPVTTKATPPPPRADKDAKEKKKEKKKPLCPYGTKCYRKNPVHFKEYSHDFSSVDPDDDDEESGSDDSDKPVCPYGADCYRKNPAHRREYRHPGPPASTTKRDGKRRSTRKKTGHRSILAGDSDDDGEVNTYDYNDSFIDDDAGSDSSSYGGDSEDADWAPPPVAPAGSGAPNDDDEDIDELLSEAKDFISNEKMRKH